MPPVGYWNYLTQDFLGIGPKPGFWPNDARRPAFNLGHLWFLEHLLIYDLLYAALRMLVVPDRKVTMRNPPLDGAIAGYAVLLPTRASSSASGTRRIAGSGSWASYDAIVGWYETLNSSLHKPF